MKKTIEIPEGYEARIEGNKVILERKQKWSETDKLHLNNAILVAKKEWGVNSYTARFLETLRDNYKKCDSRWKPSEEQIDALNSIILNGSFTYVGQVQDLISLKDELKKL